MSDNKPIALKVTLYDHEKIKALGVQAPDNLNTKDWVLGDTLNMTIIGIERHGLIEGIKVV